MANEARGDIFADFDSRSALWARNRPSAGEMEPRWHIVGPQMPRVAPVSPSHISPCGQMLHSDGLESNRSGQMTPAEKCGTCERWLEAINWD